VLVDCGIAPTMLRRVLAESRKPLEELDAVLITHEHIDHVRSIDRVLKTGLPILATAGTLRAIGHSPDRFGVAKYDVRTELPAGIAATPIAISHDANEPCGFGFEIDGVKITIVTDTGCFVEGIGSWLASSDLIVIEANHDLEMLKRGPYPLQLKRRVLSKLGHLSNTDCAAALRANLGDSSWRRTIWLAHLSEVNNIPELALTEIRSALAKAPVEHEVVALPRHETHTWIASPIPRPVRTTVRQLDLFGSSL
jgi:phosphoribosyl 1,2-cyclic phosphodiesterase